MSIITFTLSQIDQHTADHLGCRAGVLLTAEVARSEAKLGELLRKAGVPDWSALATLLVEVRHDGSGSSSRWAPYVAVLPSTCGCVLEWPRNEVRIPDVLTC